MQIKKMKTKYNLFVIAASLGFIFLYHTQVNETHDIAMNKTVERMPTNFKKALRHINIDIDYEKLPARNEIRLIGRVRAEHLDSNILDYKWTLKDNVILKKGSSTGQINLHDTKEITIDVAIKDMNKKVKVRLEATVQGTGVKLGSSQSFTYDPTEVELEAKKMEIESKALNETLTKQEKLEKSLFAPRKISTQQ
jgi:hypothetical protein